MLSIKPSLFLLRLEQDSFELELEDAIQAPPISISAPDLAFLEFTNLHTTFPLRRSVSSTELLYERAMARFYEAVELEQAAKSKTKAKATLEKNAAPPPTTTTFRKRLGSMTEAERASFERRSELRRQSADVVPMVRKWDSREDINKGLTRATTTGLLPPQYSQEEEEEEDRTESTADDSEDMDMQHDDDDEEEEEAQGQQGYDLGSDYTESTASTDQDSIEKFKMELLARTRSSSPRDLETYHPRSMGAGTFTPYRAPTPEQAALVLNRPVPLPSPDFVPKPILKRSSNEHMEQTDSSPGGPVEAATAGNDIPTASAAAPQAASNLKLDLAKGIKSFFSRDKRSATEKNTEANEELSKPLEKTNAAAIAADVETKRKAKEEEEQRRREQEQLMQEEAHAAVDHYSDLVRQVSSTHKYHKPLYLDRDELKRAAANLPADEQEEEEEQDAAAEHQQRRARSPDRDEHMLLAPPASRERRLSISEREQLVHVRDVASSHAMHKAPETPVSSEQAAHQQQQQEEPVYPTVLVVPPAQTKQSSKEGVSQEESLLSEIVEARPDARGRTRLVKVKRVIKRRVPSSTRSRDASLSSRPAATSAGTSSSVLPLERTSQSALLLSAADRQLLEKAASLAMLQCCSEEQAHEKVRSALSYSTDLVLFLVACYVYLFKDARLVLPILALMIYRQLGEAVRGYIPKWLRRKHSDGGV